MSDLGLGTGAVESKETLQSTRKNTIINSNMNVWQPGTTVTAFIDGDYGADMWELTSGAVTGVATAQQTLDHPIFTNGNCMEIDITTADTSVAAADRAGFQYRMEGFDFQNLYNRQCVLSFYIKSNKTGTYCCGFANHGTPTHTYMTEYTIDVADTWERKQIVLTFDSAGTWYTDYREGLRIRFALMMGSDNYASSTDTWNAENKRGTANQTNLFDSTSNYLRITGVQLEVGDTATDLEWRPHAEELAACQRYWEASYDIEVAPGTVTTKGGERLWMAAMNVGTHQVGDRATFKVTKRTIPSMTVYSSGTGTAGKIRDGQSATDSTGVATEVSNQGFLWYGTMNTSTSTIKPICQWVANARF